MNHKGIQLSFSMIFSLIVIIAIIGVSFYAISYFFNLGSCTEISLFHQDFQEEIDRAWNSEITQDVFVGSLPGGIDSVCFREQDSLGSGEEYTMLEDFFRAGGNVFLYPPESACDQISRSVEHIDLVGVGWHCFDVRGGVVEIPYEKGSFDALVRINT